MFDLTPPGRTASGTNVESYNASAVSGFIGIGAATAGLSQEKIDILLNAIEQISDFAVDSLLWSLTGLLGIGNNWINLIIDAVKVGAMNTAYSYLEESLKSLAENTYLKVPDVTNTGADFMVNLWGSKDELADYGIVGYRSTIGGFTPISDVHRLFNIEILGADHFDYLRRSDGDSWNRTVSGFVADLLLNATSKQKLQQFLDYPPTAYDGLITIENGRYVVRLSGYAAQI